jgi:hypothetical protein
LRQGQHADAIGRSLVELHRNGAFQKTAAAPPLVLDKSAEPKRVASFVFDKERVKFPDPHLPDSVHAQHGEKLKGIYLICVGTDGKIMNVSTVQSLSGGDASIIQQIQSTWSYKPQPTPVCSPRQFVFQFD